MTLAKPGEGGTVAVPSDEYSTVGFEDIEASDLVIPRIQIMHKEGRFKVNNTGQEFEELVCVIAGTVKQRILWAKEVDDGDRPMCKSNDHDLGFPNVSEDTPKDKRFPWAKSNFDPAQFPAGGGNSVNGLVTLPCGSCIFKEWDKGDWKQPPCNEQFTFIVFFTPDDGESWSPALLTFAKTGIKPSKQYISSFAQTKKAMFTAFTTIRLDVLSRSTVYYSVPKFTRGDQTPRDSWKEYADTYTNIRDFIRQPPRNLDEEEGAEVVKSANDSNANTGPEPAPAAAPPPEPEPAAAAATPAPAAASASDDDGDLPF